MKKAAVQGADEAIRRLLSQMGVEENDGGYQILYDALWRYIRRNRNNLNSNSKQEESPEPATPQEIGQEIFEQIMKENRELNIIASKVNVNKERLKMIKDECDRSTRQRREKMNKNMKKAAVQVKDEAIRRTLSRMGLEENDECYQILYDALWKSTSVEIRTIE